MSQKYGSGKIAYHLRADPIYIEILELLEQTSYKWLYIALKPCSKALEQLWNSFFCIFRFLA